MAAGKDDGRFNRRQDFMIFEWKKAQINHGFCGLGSDVPENLHHPTQVHGTGMYELSADAEGPLPKADVIWTRLRDKPIGIQTADCLPVLIYHQSFVCAIHAGWRGFAQQIFEVVTRRITAELEGQLSLSDCMVALGPCIGIDAFEVGPEVVDALSLPRHSADSLILKKGRGDRFHIDLQFLAKKQLESLGYDPSKVFVYRSCTFADDRLWHSYRRQGQSAGRNWSWISR